MIYFCCEDSRRELLRSPGQPLNGIDRLEVIDFDAPNQDARQRFLRVFFVKPPTGALLADLQAGAFVVSILGGERVRNMSVESAVFKTSTPTLAAHLLIEVSERGDYSVYNLRLCAPGAAGSQWAKFVPLARLDAQLASIDFSFKVECPSDLDCRETCACPPAQREEPELDYLAKDFNSFRQLMLDRLSLLAPKWRERDVADVGVTLVELLAYLGDYLSYQQDAIATEAYLGSARQRVSIRRHARLLDYPMHDGCNARVWVQIRLKASAPKKGVILPRNQALLEPVEFTASGAQKRVAGTCFATSAGVDLVLAGNEDALKEILDAKTPEVFEPLHDVFLHADHNEMNFHSWGGSQCCLPKGAVKASLAGRFEKLHSGQTLIFQERVGARTGDPADADLRKRHAIRLTSVEFTVDPLALADGTPVGGGKPQDVTEIQWAAADALPFPLCLSSIDEQGKPIANVSVALGNIVLADHGRTLPLAENLGEVPKANPALAPIVAAAGCGHCDEQPPRLVGPRYRPRLSRAGLTQSAALKQDFSSNAATTVFAQDPRAALPAARLVDDRGDLWEPQRDLISSAATAREFVAEIENDGRTRIRFGDDIAGMQPAEQTEFYARYRVGNGARGNVGAGAITQIFAPILLDAVTLAPAGSATDLVEHVTNPLPARGGIEPETIEETRQYAPEAFKEPRRCVTPEDYARRGAQHPEVQRAAATIRWTGSWHTIFLTVDRGGGQRITPEFESELIAWLESHRLAGHDLEINEPAFVSLELSLFICVAEGYFRSDVRAALLDAFSSRERPDNTRGFFHPDNWTFAQPLRVSEIYAVAQSMPGVSHVEVRALRPQDSVVSPTLPAKGEFTPGRLEVIRLENDPNFPDHGILKLELRGGR